MRKVIAAINMTLDGFCDHTAVIADDALHVQANDLLKSADSIIFGRKTYQLMEEGWAPIVKNPTGQKSLDEFAVLIDNIPKIVFSRTLKTAGWKNAVLAGGDLKSEVIKLKNQTGKNLLTGSPEIIDQLMNLELIDEYRLSLQPIVLGKGLVLFKNISQRKNLKLLRTETLSSGVVTLYYAPEK